MRKDQRYLQDIVDAVAAIQKYAGQGEDAFRSDELIQVWIIHHIQIIGEACRSLSQDLRQQNPEIPWTNIIGMRNVLVHHYFGIDKDTVWAIVTDYIPELKTNILALLEKTDQTTE